MSTRFPTRPLAVLATAMAICASFVATPRAQEPPSRSFGETVDVQRINVEVWVTDGDGNPVSGLGPEDFEIFEDGKPVEMSNFAEIHSPGPSSPFAAPDPVEAPIENADRPLALEDLLREDPREQEQSGFLVLYFDELFSGPTGRGQLIEDLRTFVELGRVPPSKVLILRQEENLRVEANLGSTRVELEEALDRLAKPSNRGLETWAADRTAVRRIQGLWERVAVLGNTAPGQDPCDFFVGEATREVQSSIERSRTKIRETLFHLENATGFLAGLPGPKTLVYVSDGLATSPGTDLLSFVNALCPGRQGARRLDYNEGLNDGFRALSRHANANRVTIYTVQSLGLRQRTSLFSADQKGVRGTSRATSRYDGEARTVQRQGLMYLAKETGGRAVYNRNSFIEDFEQIAEDMSTYYSLAYEPPHGGDGLEHDIEVVVRDREPLLDESASRGKLRVRYRPGYRDKNLDERRLERLESTLYLNLMANPLDVKLGVGKVVKGEGKTSKVELHVMVPVEKIAFLPQQGGDFARLRVQVLARDEANRKTAFKQEGFDLERPEQQDADQVSLVLHLDLEAGIHVVAFGVHDESTQEASFVATGLEILG